MNVIDLTVGFVAGVIITALFTVFMINRYKDRASESSYLSALLMVFGALAVTALTLSPSGMAAAQTPAPIPTLNIPVGELFTQTNFWMGTLAPVTAVGVGITIAVAVLGYVGAMISGAFRR